jgi:transketolase
MINKKAKLSNKMFKRGVDMVATRDGYGEGLVEAGEEDEKVVVLCADLTESTRSEYFRKRFPERFIEVGVAEQALATIASGMANYGKIPFISSYAVFSPGRNWEQIRTTAALNDVPVKIAGAHAGLTVGPDGATHQALEDIALMRAIPNMTVLVPCDLIETKKATVAAATNKKPTYIRFTKQKTPVMTTEDTPFEIGKAEVLWSSLKPKSEVRSPKSIAIIGCGPILYESLKAAKKLMTGSNLVSAVVINCHTVKPIDEETIVKYAKRCGAVVTVEEHQVNGGLGSAVSEVLAKNYPVPMEFVGMLDSFGESGKPHELLRKYKMTVDDIVRACRRVIRRKGK